MHHLLALLWFFYFHYLLGAFIGASFFLMVFAIFGVETGIHRKYVQFLLKVFEFCRQTIEKKEKKRHRRKHHLRQNGDDDCGCSVSTITRTSSNASSNVSGDQGLGTSQSVSESSLTTTTPSNEVEEELSSDNDSDTNEVRHRILSFSENVEPRDFKLEDIFDFIQNGVQVMVDDEVTKRFDAEEIRCWNLLTRTSRNYQLTSWRLTVYWLVGFFVRMYMLFPIRLAIFTFGMLFILVTTYLIGFLKDGPFKRWLYNRTSVTAFRILSRSVSAVINYHNEQYRPKSAGICVANHTSPFDVVMLHCGSPFALVGQLHDGFLGILERALSRATSHVFFDRSEVTDRLAVVRKMREHVSDPKKLPILIFPEGTCINNSAVMMFKKGSFEVASTVFPVAIKYDPIFGDPFWNSSRHGYFTYTLRMMTSWAIVCDVWYLPPMTRKENESAVEFANRVKAAIAKQGGLVDLEWDGQVKRSMPRPELKLKVQKNFSRKISVRSSIPPPIAAIIQAGDNNGSSESSDAVGNGPTTTTTTISIESKESKKVE